MQIEDMIQNNRADCSGCAACKNICPKNCITMQRDAEGFDYPKINHEVCIKCGRCDATCPALNFKQTLPNKLPEVFVAVNPDAKTRRHSSSGGTFSALAELILSTGGIVFGAGFDGNWRVVHTSAENLDELENLRGSKYVQSQIGDVYKRVKVELESGRRVLFSGTPCQCAGLKSFLGKDYSNLLTVDIICHGTPSPFLWENYVEYIAQGHDIARVNFRSKRFGWVTNHLEINFYDCGYYAKSNGQDLFLKHFLHGMTERPSCHSCKFKFPNGKSDVTIGDAWGVQNFAPNFFDNRGTSLVIVHTDNGRNFLSKARLAGQQVSFDVLPRHNPCFLTPSIPDSRRANFFKDLKNFPHLPIAVMQKYFMQNPQKVVPDGRNLHQEAMNKYGAILRYINEHRNSNLLLITPTVDKYFSEFLTEDILKNFKDSGVYVIQMTGDGQIIFVDARHGVINFKVPANFGNIQGLLKDFHITEIFVDERLNFDEGSMNWLVEQGLTIQIF